MDKLVQPIFWRFGWFVGNRPDCHIAVYEGNDMWKRFHGRLFFLFKDVT